MTYRKYAIAAAAMVLGMGSLNASADYVETFDTDVADAATFATTYPDFTTVGTAHSVVGGVIQAGASAQDEILISSAAAGFGADFGSHYTVTGDIGTLGGTPLNYSATLMIGGNLGIEFGQSSGGNEFFRVIARDFPTSTASVGGIPVQVPDIGFDIVDGSLYTVVADILRNGDGTVELNVSVADANSAAVYVMPTEIYSAADAPLLFGTYDEVGFRKRGGDAGQGLFDNLTITPEPASLALLGLGGLMMLRRRR